MKQSVVETGEAEITGNNTQSNKIFNIQPGPTIIWIQNTMSHQFSYDVVIELIKAVTIPVYLAGAQGSKTLAKSYVVMGIRGK